MNEAVMSVWPAARPVFAWTGTGGLPDDVAKGEWFTDPSGKMRKAMTDLPKGIVPWLDPVDIGAFADVPNIFEGYSASATVTINASGIRPTEFKVLIAPKAVEDKIGSILLPDQKKEADKYATMEGHLIDLSHLAFTYATDDEWAGKKPKPGDRILYAKYAGVRHKGKDGTEYVLANDKDVVAILED